MNVYTLPILLVDGDLNPYHILIHMSLTTALYYSIIILDCIQSKHRLSKANVTQVVMIGNRCFPRQFSSLSMMSNCF